LANKVIYLDHAATTSPIKEVVSIYNEALTTSFYNPASAHQAGTIVNRELENARSDILRSFGLSSYNLIFTSGASESNNLALKGYAHRYLRRGKHIITSSFEHPSVTNPLKALENEGFEVTYLKGNDGYISLEELEKAIRPDTILVSIMAVNNEVGFIQDIKGISKIVHSHGIKLHIDAVQAVGKIATPYSDADLITVSMHKIGGLKSSGLLLYKKGIELTSLIDGGGQENNIRSGTNDVPMALADAFAIKYALSHQKESYEYCLELVKPLYEYLSNHSDLYEINSTIDNPFIVNFSFKNKKASVFVEALSSLGIMVASKSACSSRLDKGSVTLLAIGKNSQLANNAIRLSFSSSNNKEDIETFINTLDKLVKELRA
jgi:cysteine desulfurase